MDLSFSNQFHAMLYLKNHSKELENQVYVLPREIDETIARLKLEAMGITIDKLTPEQERYHLDYAEGT
jgi:adenosylhomocysteinase